jgi:arylsulfatase A-like enzyme
MGELRGRKFTLWEGGIRVPAIMYWPGRVPENVVSKQPIIHMDWTATFLALADAEPDEKFPLDGVNIMPLLAEPENIASRTFFWRVSQRNQQHAVRDGNWKYLKTEEDEYLFNLDIDPSEANDLKQTETEKLVELKSKFESWSTQVLPPLGLAK